MIRTLRIFAIVFAFVFSVSGSVFAQGPLENAREFSQKVVEQAESRSTNEPGQGSDYIELEDSSGQNDPNAVVQIGQQNQ